MTIIMIGGIDGRRDDWPPETREVSVVCWLGGRQWGVEVQLISFW